MNKVIDLFIQLVKIDSPSGQEQGMISFVQNWLKQHKLKYKTDASGNILAKNDGMGKPILFCVHMDTVEPGRGIKPNIKNGVIKSSGDTILGADNKAAIACLLSAVEQYLKTDKKQKAFELLFTVNEETTGGLASFPFKWIKSEICLVFDSAKPLGGIILRSPYIINFHAEFTGKAVHSSMPEKGVNALLPVINGLTKIPIGTTDKSQTTINIGLIKGGSGINTIPEKVIISGEIRSYQKQLFNKNLKKIELTLQETAKKNHVQFKFSKDGYCPGYSHSIHDEFIQQIKNLLYKIRLKSQFYYYSGVSDANLLNSKGIETINLGDAVENAHTSNEQIKIKDLQMLHKIILNLLRRKNWGT